MGQTKNKSGLVKNLKGFFLQNKKLVFAFINSPLTGENDWRRLEKTVENFYGINIGHGRILSLVKTDSKGEVVVRQPVTRVIGPPMPAPEERRAWLQSLREKTREYLEDCYAQFNRKEGADPFSLPEIPYAAGIRHTVIDEGMVAHVYNSQDPTSAFLLLVGDMLSEPDTLSKIQRCRCGNLFYKTGRQKYCIKDCTRQAHLSGPRVRDLRKRRAAWEQACTKLAVLLAEIDAIAQKRKLRRPRSERELLEEAEEVLRKVRNAFANAFRRKLGKAYEEGQILLAQASAKIKRLRKKVKGY
jgi:hypothetical protein